MTEDHKLMTPKDVFPTAAEDLRDHTTRRCRCSSPAVCALVQEILREQIARADRQRDLRKETA